MGGSIYQRRSVVAPDSDFESGEWSHLTVGRRGRLLDARRTPVTVTGARLARAAFTVRLDDFEDAGAEWELPLWEVSHFQFAPGGERVEASMLAAMATQSERFDRPWVVPADVAARPSTLRRIDAEQQQARAWLAERSRFVRDGGQLPEPLVRRGSEALFEDTQRYLEQRNVGEMDAAFATRWVSNPHSGELVKGHLVVLAELGLAPFHGQVIRDAGLFEGPWSRAQRAQHIVTRLGFMRALLDLCAGGRLTLYRGWSSPVKSPVRRRGGLVAATLCEQVARSHFEIEDQAVVRSWRRQTVSADRVLLSYLETAQLNAPFREAEVVLVDDGAQALF